MKIIIPMAGIGKRMRPHTLTLPKPLFPIAGKPMVQHIVEMIVGSTQDRVDEIAFIIGPPGGIFGEETIHQLTTIANKNGSTAKIYYQDKPLGTAHAVLCASDSLKGKVVVVFADTLFRGTISIHDLADGIIWVKKVDDPRPFGVVTTDENRKITEFVEKSPVFVSDQAIIGLYYFRNGEVLRNELQYLIDHDIKDKGEYQLTNALDNMKNKGMRFISADIDEWLDCGNKDNTLTTHRRILETYPSFSVINEDSLLENSKIIPPAFIGNNVRIIRSTVGPFVSVSDHTTIQDSLITNSIILSNTTITEAHLNNSIVGNHVTFKGEEERKMEVNIGDYSMIY